MMLDRKPIVGITIGDINGVGPEVILKVFSERNLFDTCIPVVYGSAKILKAHQQLLSLPEINCNIIEDEKEVINGMLNVIEISDDIPEIKIGKDCSDSGEFALQSLEKASNSLKLNQIDVLLTAPLNKQNINIAGFKGHTGYLTEKLGANDSLMIMSSDKLKVALVTEHIPINQVSLNVSHKLILQKLKIFYSSLLEDYGIENPKIAVLGLNPHAGDGGLIGDEDLEIISKTIDVSIAQGVNAFGPFSADGFFGSRSYLEYDGVLAMYHDQGLIPFKTITFDKGVNFTAGLSDVRTSPAHGVAYDIAGENLASSQSFKDALLLACEIHRRRIENKL